VPEGADVVIRYEFLPTDASIRQSAERVVKQINQSFGSAKTERADLSPDIKKISSSQKKALKSMDDLFINLFRVMSPRVQLATKLISGRKLQAGFEEGSEATAGGSGGLLKGIASMAGLMGIMTGGILIISAFFEAVGPFLKVFVKVLSAFILIILAPILRALAPHIRSIIQIMLGFGKWLAGGMQKLVDVFIGLAEYFSEKPGQAIASAGVLTLGLIFAAGAVSSGLSWLIDATGKLITSQTVQLGIEAAKNSITKFLATNVIGNISVGTLLKGGLTAIATIYIGMKVLDILGKGQMTWQDFWDLILPVAWMGFAFGGPVGAAVAIGALLIVTLKMQVSPEDLENKIKEYNSKLEKLREATNLSYENWKKDQEAKISQRQWWENIITPLGTSKWDYGVYLAEFEADFLKTFNELQGLAGLSGNKELQKQLDDYEKAYKDMSAMISASRPQGEGVFGLATKEQFDYSVNQANASAKSIGDSWQIIGVSVENSLNEAQQKLEEFGPAMKTTADANIKTPMEQTMQATKIVTLDLSQNTVKGITQSVIDNEKPLKIALDTCLVTPFISAIAVIMQQLTALDNMYRAVTTRSATSNALTKTTSSIFTSIGSAINSINAVVKGGFTSGNASGGGGGGGGFKDFISRPGMGVSSFSPSDTIIGVKNPENLGGQSVVINNTFNVDGNVDKTELKKIFSDFSRDQARELRMRTSYVGGFYA